MNKCFIMEIFWGEKYSWMCRKTFVNVSKIFGNVSKNICECAEKYSWMCLKNICEFAEKNIRECVEKYSEMRRKTFVNVSKNICECVEKYSWMCRKIFVNVSKKCSWMCRKIFENASKKFRECVEKLRPRCWPQETTICYKISLVQWLITILNVTLYLSTCHTVYISVLIIFMIMP